MTTVTTRDEQWLETTLRAPERFDTVVIGGGQAGLAAGYHLARKGIDFVILDANDRIGDAWRNRWDSLTLFTPSRFTSLPGMPLPGPQWAYPTKDEVADYLERYATTMDLPVRAGVEAHKVSRAADGGWLVETGDVQLAADAVIIATGGYQTPKIPEWSKDLNPDILQLHSTDYRNPSQFQPGPVLVVGASHSGADIAVEAARSHHTVLAGRDTGQVPLPTTGPLSRPATLLIWFAVNHVLTVKTPIGRKAKRQLRHHGFPLERPSRNDIAAAGIERITQRVAGVRDGKPALDDGRVLDVRTIVWCTGFTGDYSWVDGVTYDDDGYPDQHEGAAVSAPGLYFVGLRFQHAGASSLLGGVGRDAARVVDQIADSVRQRAVA